MCWICIAQFLNACMVTLHSNIKTEGGRLLLLTLKKSKYKEEKNSGDRTWISSVIDQQDNHFTTPTADSVIYICIRPFLGGD